MTKQQQNKFIAIKQQKITLLILGGILFLMIMGSLSNDSSSSLKVDSTIQSQRVMIDPPLHLINMISDRIDGDKSCIVQSNDFSKVYFVAAAFKEIYDEYVIGLWATNSMQNESKTIFSVNDVALQTTSWPDDLKLNYL